VTAVTAKKLLIVETLNCRKLLNFATALSGEVSSLMVLSTITDVIALTVLHQIRSRASGISEQRVRRYRLALETFIHE
jgi:hypothetical protein